MNDIERLAMDLEMREARALNLVWDKYNSPKEVARRRRMRAGYLKVADAESLARILAYEQINRVRTERRTVIRDAVKALTKWAQP